MSTSPLSLSDTLRLFDSADQLRLAAATHPAVVAQVAHAFQEVSAAQGLPVSQDFASQVVAHAVSMSTLMESERPWDRPQSGEEWEEKKRLLNAQLARAKRHENWSWGCVMIGASITASVAGWLLWPHHDGTSFASALISTGLLGTVFFVGGFGLLSLVSSVVNAIVKRWYPIDVDKIEMALSLLKPYQMNKKEALKFTRVPGLSGCLSAIMESPVPFLVSDLHEAKRRLRVHLKETAAAKKEKGAQDVRALIREIAAEEAHF